MRILPFVLVLCAACTPVATDSKSADGCPIVETAPDALTWELLTLAAPSTLGVSVVNNCVGDGALSILAEVDDPAFVVESGALSVEPGGAGTVEVTATLDDYTGAAGTLTLTTNDPETPVIAIPLSASADSDGDGDGYTALGAGGDDCDDTDPAVHPGAADAWYDGVDGDCDGADDFDQDADGYDVDTDCDDTEPEVHPDAGDTWYDGVDGDCDGADDYDQDGDGVTVDTDCDDTEPSTFPGAPDAWYDGVDSNCDGADDDDQDADGFPVDLDCDDVDPAVFPGAPDAWYDGVDSNCDGASDFDQDADGYDTDVDCDDLDPSFSPGVAETWYDGIDSNCDGADDYDQDGDGHELGDDCDDTSAIAYPGATEVWYDGVDGDCAGGDDYDQDADGYQLADDCDDTAASVHPGAVETWYDGVDGDCDGADDYDQDADGYDVDVDCEDLDGGVHPGATEVWYDGVDGDCDGGSDYDQDGDGYDLGDDCDDVAPAVNPGAVETWYDGLDSDCDGASDFDQDGDGADLGPDCDDTSAAFGPDVVETWYDGVDANCDGLSDYDQDGDGADSDAWGGDDCLDTDAAAYVGAAEVWYDGVDEACDGGSDYDQDGDGVDSIPWGADCADWDPATTAGSAEVLNGLDDDCDGFVDEGFAEVGDVVVTEVMANPAAVSDTVGEWFEVYNTTAYTIDMTGWTVYSDDGGSLVLGALSVPAGGFAVLGTEDDSSLNGGVTVDYQYDRSSFSFADSGDSIYLVSGSTTVAELVWTGTWPGASGKSMQLDNDHYDATDRATRSAWCASTTKFATDSGTPGAANGDCSSLDDDGDGAGNGDCDDDDPTRFPDAVEVVDGIDQNCNDFADEDSVSISTAPYLSGAISGAYMLVAGLGDVDADGVLDVVSRDEDGDLHVIAGAGYTSWAGKVESFDTGSFRTSSSVGTAFEFPNAFRDVTGDGLDDLVLGGSASGVTGFHVFEAPIATSGTVSPDASMTRSESYNTGVQARLDVSADFDGDGINDVLCGNDYSTYAGGSGFTYYGTVGIWQGGSLGASMGYGDAAVTWSGDASHTRFGYVAQAGDVNGDGYPDVVSSTSSTIYVLFGDGLATTGDWTGPSVADGTVTYSLGSSGDLGLRDADADGVAELFVDSDVGYVYWYADLAGGGTATRTATMASTYFLTGGLDTDGDGIEQPAFSVSDGSGGYIVAVYEPWAFDDAALDGSEAAWATATADIPYGVPDFVSGDLDGDGSAEGIVYAFTMSVASSGSMEGGLMVAEP